jgi:hypothetical protein
LGGFAVSLPLWNCPVANSSRSSFLLITMAQPERQVIRGVEFTRVIRLDGKGNLWFYNDRVFTLDRRTLTMICAYNKLDVRVDGGKFEAAAPACNADHTEFCGHIVPPYALAFADFVRALRLALFALRSHCYPNLLKAEVGEVFRAIKVEFFGIYEFTFAAFWAAREHSVKSLRIGVTPWAFSQDLEVELAAYHQIRPLFRPFLDNYREQVPPVEPEEPVDPLEPETPEMAAFRAAGEALARSLGERAISVRLTSRPVGRGRGRARPINREYNF